MGNKFSKMSNDDDVTKDSNKELTTKSNEVVCDENPENKTCFIGSKVPEFEKDVYLPKTDAVGILKREDLEGVFTVLYFFSGDFDPGVLPEISELKKMTLHHSFKGRLSSPKDKFSEKFKREGRGQWLTRVKKVNSRREREI